MGLCGKNGRVLMLWLLSCATAHGAITVTARGTYQNNASSSASMTPGPSSTIAVGSAGVMVIGIDNAVNGGGGDLPVTATDSAGNTWYKINIAVQANGTNAGAECGIYWADIVTPVTNTDTVTVTFNSANVTAKTAAFWELNPSAGNRVLRIVGTFKGVTASSAAPTLTSTNLIGIGNVQIGAVAAESVDAFTADPGTTNGTWSTSQHTGIGTGLAAMSLITQYKIQTTVSSVQTYQPTISASADNAELMNTFIEVGSRVRQVGVNVTNATTQTGIFPEVPMPVGSLGVLCVSSDNAAGTGDIVNYGSTPVTDSVSNTWTTRQNAVYDPGSAAAGAEFAIFTAPITTALTNTGSFFTPSPSITVTFSISTVNKSWVLLEFAPTAGGNTWGYVAGTGGSSGATSASPTVTTTSITSGDTVLAMGAAEDADTWTADSDTSNGSWGTATHAGAAAATMSIIVQTKAVTGTATQTFNPTLAGTPDNILGWITLHESSGVSLNTGSFFQMFQ
jgi:hypothetical protein